MPEFHQNVVSKLVKIAGSAVFLVLDEMARFVRQLLGLPLKRRITVLFYHQVMPQERERFARQMDRVLRWAEPLRAGDTAVLAGDHRYVVVTADDGWQSFVDNALPELQTRKIPVTIFVISGQLGQTLGAEGDRILDDAQLRAIANGLVTIGSHTHTHLRLTTASRASALCELNTSRAILRLITGTPIDLFCFPFGSYDLGLVELCREAGYRQVFKSIPNVDADDRHEFLAGRVRVDPSDWPIEFYLKMLGGYRWLSVAVELKRRILTPFRSQSQLSVVRD